MDSLSTNIWRCRYLCRRTKIWIFKSLVIPVLLYGSGEGDDVERLAGRKSEGGRPAQSVIIPVYRRDCYEEVYAGSHSYPGTGVYLLKFDNSYSLWRSKTLYYRVYYTR
ncbi:Golgi resident protein GCP60 [Chionoecetes opilio]|uniref:Golgi resident protein GCP60 n=1 Tax=Chionoecetes opilio TaxID=41210 RepID=A0A8J4YFW3_CHIOP|nr:Golgi resident protein GCP60 [Chionoecetes opilio]